SIACLIPAWASQVRESPYTSTRRGGVCAGDGVADPTRTAPITTEHAMTATTRERTRAHLLATQCSPPLEASPHPHGGADERRRERHVVHEGVHDREPAAPVGVVDTDA